MAMHFDLVDLRLMSSIAETNSLTRGAERSCMSVPAASTRIKNLEESMGTKLLFRTSQGVTLTPPGQAFLHHARMVLSQLEQLRGDMQEYARGIKGHIRLFANTTATTEFLPADLRDFLGSHPDVSIGIKERLSPDIVRAVSEGWADVGIVAGDGRADSLMTLPYRQDKLILAVNPSHPLAARASIPFADAMGYDFIGMPEASAIHGFLNRVASEMHKSLHVRIEVGNFEALCRMVEADIGIGVLPLSSAVRYVRAMDVRLVEIEDAWSIRNLVICFRSFELLPSFTRDLVNQLTSRAGAADALPLA
ncbi:MULTISPECIES: LysR substrate-binding domain-containing protein [unclassified Burkholderia]|uniref:LysR substrate-binding domain-containing protein n=1 Tax=unclassified Burkholderia TaxID=2613784 RepID=UPI00141EAD04|nr:MULTISPECIES: LysR substrate-binding domain-containing protein [unclassified Burkholderia]NIF69894.1 LysR family transcriptional regulator [Burkholderia sp. Ap-962]NIF87752.1 LysR family transcriptional regulator [Burkholderia sp. Cy-637]